MLLRPSILGWICLVIMIIAGIDLGLLGIFGMDLTHLFFTPMSLGSRFCYIVAGIAAIYFVYDCFRPQRTTQP